MVDASGYATLVGDGHRRRHGQFFTPPSVARFMVEWVLSGGARTVHDPAFGLGAFHDAASRHPEVHFSASERDPTILNYYRSRTPGAPADLRQEDYLLSWGRRFDAIVCNPPYLRFQHFRDRKTVFPELERRLELRLSGYTNCASAFLLKSLAELKPGGRLAYVMPLEFLNTGYGTEVKRRLISPPAFVRLIQLHCERDLFPDAVTSVGVVLFESVMSNSKVAFHTVRCLEELDPILDTPPVVAMSGRSLRPDKKWLPHFAPSRLQVNDTLTGTLRQYGRFTRGIATGANKFFVLRRSDARTLDLDATEVTPCITRSKQVRNGVLTEGNMHQLDREDQPVVLFRPGRDLSDGAVRYVARGEQEQLHQRFLLRHRSPWYKGESRRPSPLLFGVFSRGDYKVVLNRTPALNLTCFHGFIPSLPGRRYVDRLFLYLASSTGRELLVDSSRRYGDALMKYEPEDLNGAIAPRPGFLDELSEEDVADAVGRVEAGLGLPRSVEEHFRRLTA